MERTAVTVVAGSAETAQAEGARELGVQSAQVTVEKLGESEYTVTLKNVVTHFDIVVNEDKMVVTLDIQPPAERYSVPVTVEDVEKGLAEQKITFGIDKAAIEKAVAEVVATREARSNVIAAVGTPPVSGHDADIEIRVGSGAANKDPQSSYSVKVGQIVAVKTLATAGTKGTNVFDQEVPCVPGQDRELTAGENIGVSEDGGTFVSELYGIAEVVANLISVKPCVQVVEDGLLAQMVLSRLLSDNTPVVLSDVLGALAAAGVVHGIKEDEIVAALKAGQPSQDIVLAEATPAQNGKNASIAFKFRLNGESPEVVVASRMDKALTDASITKEFVSARDVLAIRTPQQPPVEGCLVTGKKIDGKKPKDKILELGANVSLLDDGMTYVVADGAMGYANLVGNTLCLEDPISVSEDSLTASFCAQPPSTAGKMISAKEVGELLKGRSIVHGADAAAIAQALQHAVTTGKPVCDAPIARGRLPQDGRDAQIAFKFQLEESPGALNDETGKMDYKERGILQKVLAGDLLATKTLATPGEEGIDVFGKTLAAAHGKDRELTAVENVDISDDGSAYTAKIDGVVMLTGEDKIGVFQHYEVPGDVDYSTGNLNMDGTLSVHGWIRSGFTVRTSGDLCVKAGIEDAIVEAGGNVEVGGGIIGKKIGTVRAGGDIRALFIENARLYADGDVVVQESIVRSAVVAGGRVDLTEGKGRVIGGSVAGRKGIEANEIGSEFTVRTVVSAGAGVDSLRRMAALQKELARYRRNAKKIAMSIALLAGKGKRRTITRHKAGQLAKVVKQTKLAKLRREEVLKKDRLAKYKKALAQTAEQEGRQVAIRVRKSVYEGTVVILAGHRLPVREDIQAEGKFVLDTNDWAVKYLRQSGKEGAAP